MTEERHLTPAEQRIMHRALRRSQRIKEELAERPGEWQAATMERLMALGFAGFIFGPGVNWWPMDAEQRKVAGPFTSTAEFDAWLGAQEARKTCDHAGYTFAKHGRCCPHCDTFMVDFGD